MLNLFRKNHFLNSLLLLPYILLLRLPLWLGETEIHIPEHTMLQWLKLSDMSFFWHWIIGSLLLFFQTLVINRMIIRNRLLRDPSLLGGLGYLVLTGFFPTMTVVSPEMLAMSFFIPAVSYLFDIYKKYQVDIDMFNAGLLLGLACLLEPSFIGMVSIGLVALLKLRSFKTRELLQYVNAFLLPFWLAWGCLYLSDKPEIFYSYFAEITLDFERISNIWQMGYFRWTVIIAATITALFTFNGHLLKKSIQAQKKIEILYWILLFTPAVALAGTELSDHDFLPFFFPIGCLLGMSIHRSPNKALAELIHIALFVAGFTNHFFDWW